MKLAETQEHKQILQLLKDIQCNYKAVGEYLPFQNKLSYCPYPEVDGNSFGRMVVEKLIETLEKKGNTIVVENR